MTVSSELRSSVHILRLYKTKQLAPFFLCEDLHMNFSLHLLFRDLLANGTSEHYVNTPWSPSQNLWVRTQRKVMEIGG